MATSILRTPPNFRASLNFSEFSSKSIAKLQCISLVNTQPKRCRLYRSYKCFSSGGKKLGNRLNKFGIFASNGAEFTETQDIQEKERLDKSNAEENADGAVGFEDAAIDGEGTDVEGPGSAVIASLQLYREALANNDELKVAEVEALLKSIEDEKVDLENKVITLTKELSYEKERVLRISADFDNFRKRTERERLSLVTNAKGEVAENLLPVLDNFERAKAQIKIETEGEEKISNSYQNIYKQFAEILGSLGVVPVETVGKPFDPMLHEAIMREDSTEYEEGVIIEQYRKGFKLGDRLLRPSMVKVSAGPGPVEPQAVEQSEEAETGEEEPAEPESAED